MYASVKPAVTGLCYATERLRRHADGSPYLSADALPHGHRRIYFHRYGRDQPHQSKTSEHSPLTHAASTRLA